MRIQEEIRDDVVILSLKGDMMGEPDTTNFREAVALKLAEGKKKFILDFGGVKWMNSLGLGALIATYTSTKSNGGEMVIVNVTKKVESLFMITQLIKVFRHYQSLDEALAELNKN